MLSSQRQIAADTGIRDQMNNFSEHMPSSRHEGSTDEMTACSLVYFTTLSATKVKSKFKKIMSGHNIRGSITEVLEGMKASDLCLEVEDNGCAVVVFSDEASKCFHHNIRG